MRYQCGGVQKNWLNLITALELVKCIKYNIDRLKISRENVGKYLILWQIFGFIFGKFRYILHKFRMKKSVYVFLIFLYEK